MLGNGNRFRLMVALALMAGACGGVDGDGELGPAGLAAARPGPYHLVTGAFVIRTSPYSYDMSMLPDGDTLYFRPDARQTLQAHGVPFTDDGLVQVHLQGTDTLELYYLHTHQQLALAEAARAAQLPLLGFTQVTYDRPHDDGVNYVASVEPAEVRGHLLVTGHDAYYRALGFAFAGDPSCAAIPETPCADGEEVALDATLVTASVNGQMLAQGWAYPLFYRDLPAERRDDLAQLVVDARARALGVWAADQTNTGALVDSLEGLQQRVVHPALFRRLAQLLFRSAGQAPRSLEQAFAATEVAVVGGPRQTDGWSWQVLSELVTVEAAGRTLGSRPDPGEQPQTVRLNVEPERLVFRR